ncbi:hypothetical protein FCV25MIE_18382 [Fagus crenata]
MLGTGLQFGRAHGEDWFYNLAKMCRAHQNQNQQSEQLRRVQNDVTPTQSASVCEKMWVNREPENRAGSDELPKPVVVAAVEPVTTIRGFRSCDVEFQPYFVLGDLWESFKEWSTYGAGVPLILNDSDSIVQYYVLYLSGIQIYGESTKSSAKLRRQGEDSDNEFRDSSSDGSSDCEPERGLKHIREQRNHHHLSSVIPLRMDRLSLRDQPIALHEDFSSDEGESMNSQGSLLFEYLERDLPYSHEPLADKIADIACRFPELKTLRSCDLLSSSWISVAWYPIYRIPTGPTLKDLDACFLTYHSLYTCVGFGREPVRLSFKLTSSSWRFAR